MSLKYKILIGVLVLLIFTFVGLGVYATNVYKEADQAVTESFEDLERGNVSEKRDQEVDPEVDNISVLFVGIDDATSRTDEANLADALILATFNKDDNSINMVSIPRDSYVDVPYQLEKDKINHTHAYDGLDGTVTAVEDLLDIPVDYYVRLDFQAFVEVVDAIDGIPFDVPYDLEESNSNDEKGEIVLRQGKQILNGEEALAIARTRKNDNDLKRGERQMEVVETILDETLSFSSITKYNSIIQSVGSNMNTNLAFNQLVDMHKYVTSKDGLNIEQHQLNGSDYMNNGVYYYQLDENSVVDISDKLKTHLNISSQIANKEKPDDQS
ncbi:LCP family protein [Halalkalibacillus halophilus]|uniref:LCP family protein n=1 Tax=Halalkalibacillus halophilus TaxID=392827 RepID=UPI00040D4354|nr:LCP family protein [Halalkalibacillus halophilus]